MEGRREVDTVVEDPAWIRAQKRARNQREFYGHLTMYVLVSALLVVIDLAGGKQASTFLGLDWAFWPICGWGIAVVLHAVRVFGPGSNWEERKAAELYQQERDR